MYNTGRQAFLCPGLLIGGRLVALRTLVEERRFGLVVLHDCRIAAAEVPHNHEDAGRVLCTNIAYEGPKRSGWVRDILKDDTCVHRGHIRRRA